MTTHRIAHRGYSEWLKPDGNATASDVKAATFSSYTDAATFLIRCKRGPEWHIQAISVGDVAPEVARGCATKVIP